MKRYLYNGIRYWFEPEQAPDGAVEIGKKEPAPKARAPRNKAKAASNKRGAK